MNIWNKQYPYMHVIVLLTLPFVLTGCGFACLFGLPYDDNDPCTFDTCFEFQRFSVPLCDDGLFCNGVETCEDGICSSGIPPCRSFEDGLVCDEDLNQCV